MFKREASKWKAIIRQATKIGVWYRAGLGGQTTNDKWYRHKQKVSVQWVHGLGK